MSGNVALNNLPAVAEQEDQQPIDLGAAKIKKMLAELGIKEYDLLPYSKLVKFKNRNHLTRVFVFLKGCELYERQNLSIDKSSGEVTLETGDSWRFEAIS